jgi:hypothetical protein
MKFDFASIMKLVNLIPVICAGIEHIHGDSKAGADKKQLAKESLALATGVAGYALPQFGNEIGASSAAVDQMIDSTVAMMNTAGIFSKKK